ncbi:MAG: chemotaxis protein CheX [Armatimonadota bacterium]
MRVEFIEPFLSAAFNIFQTFSGQEPTRGDLALRRSTFTTQHINIMAGVNGNIEGNVLYGMSLGTAQKIAGAMIGSEIDVIDEMAWSALSELGNMITGNAITLLSQKGYTVDITPPSVIRGVDLEVSTKVPALVVPVTTAFGRIEVNVALLEVAKKAA